MIRVPTVDQGSIAPEMGPNVSAGQQVSAEGMGANVGEALQNLGGSIGEVMQREQMRANLATLNQARIDLAQNEANLFDPNNPDGVYAKKGLDAMQGPSIVRQNLNQFYQDYQQKLTNPMVREEFSRMFAMHQLGVLDRANSYALQQKDHYEQQSFEGAVGSALSDATTKAQAGDADGSLQAQLDGIATIKQFGETNGWAPDYTQYSVDKFTKTVQAANEAATKASVEQSILQDPQTALHDLSARLGIAQYSPDSQAISGDPNAPRGIRNNNPGNIRKSDVAWQGKVPSTDPSYEAFASPTAGIRALALNALHLQQKQGAQTISDLISAWAPANENDTQAYIADVSKQTGIAPDTPIDLQNPQQLTALTNAIITHENGKNPYSQQQIDAGVQAALGKSKLADSHPPVAVNASGMVVPADGTSAPIGQLNRTGNFQIDSLKTADAVELYNRAREEVNRNQVNMRASIEQRVRDDTAAFRSGQSVQQPLTLAEFTQAYGDKQGMTAYGAYAADQQLGKDLQTVATLNPQQMQALAQTRSPQPGENFAVKAEDQRILQSAMAQTLQARQKDPALWAMTAGVGGVQPLDISSPDKLASSLATRGAAMQTVAQSYQTPYRMLSQTEQSALSGTINGMSAKDKTIFLGAISSKLQPVDYQQIVDAIKPNSPVTAMAGQIMGAGHAAQVGTTGSLWWKQPTTLDAQDVAETALQGDALINPTKADKDANGAPKFAMPSDNSTTGLRGPWNDVVGDAFRGDGAAEMQAYQFYRALYAGLAAKQGKADGVMDASIAQEAARATLGNIVQWGKHNVIPPYGMSENAFTDAVNQQWQAVRANVPGFDGEDANAFDLDRIGNNAYALSSGGAPVLTKDHKPVILRIPYPSRTTGVQAAQPQAPAQSKPSRADDNINLFMATQPQAAPTMAG